MDANKMLYPWGHTRRFNAYTDYIRKVFGGRVQKLSIDAGFSCPNRDGTLSTSGCIFCNSEAFSPSYCLPEKSVSQQLEEGIIFHKTRYRRNQGYLAYFQAYSNTHGNLHRLQQLYEEALHYPGVLGLVIGTRPDCVDEAKLDYLAHLSENRYVSIEYGIESCYNKTLNLIARGHTFDQAVWALEESRKRNLNTCAHFILGLPGESREMILEQSHIISQLPITTVKLHQLQVLKNTVLEKMYLMESSKFKLYELEEYIDLVTDFVEKLNPGIVVERFTAEVPQRFLVAPDWGLLRTDQILERIEKRLEEKDTWQGKKQRIL